MGSRGNNNGGTGGGGAVVGLQSIPAGSRNMVQSLKEIVNCPELEIYAMLKECNMDPNEAVNRLLSQDPFHEVRSKRDKKKENKDAVDPKVRVSSSMSRGYKSGTDRYIGRGGSLQYTSAESGALHAKITYRKENELSFLGSATSAFEVGAKNTSHQSSILSDSSTVNKVSTESITDGISSVSQATPVYQPAWSGAPRQISLADIVKLGKPNSKCTTGPNSSHSITNQHVQASHASYHDVRSSEVCGSKVPDTNHELEAATGQHLLLNDDWLLVDQPPSSNFPQEPTADSVLHADPSNSQLERTDCHPSSQAIEGQVDEDSDDESFGANHVGSGSVSSRKVLEDNIEDVAVSVSSVAVDLQQLHMTREDQREPHEESVPSVVIPGHLQVQTADCLHLSFGSFGSGIPVVFSGVSASRPLKTNLEVSTTAADASSAGHSDVRNSEYYEDDSLGKPSEDNLAHTINVGPGDYDTASDSHPEILKQGTAEIARGNQYAFSTPTGGYSFENGQQLNASFSQAETNSHLAPLSNVMAYTNSLPSALVAANQIPLREIDRTYSPFPPTQTMSTKYGNSVSSISATSISMPEVINAVNFPSNQHVPQTLSGTSVATGPGLPQHVAVHPYSQPSLPMGPFTNMIGFPMLPQGYPYMPSAFQQAFAGNSSYPQSLAAILPQYKNSVSVSSLPQSGTVASGYGAFGNSTVIPGNFSINSSATPAAGGGSTNIGYDDIMGSQHKESIHLHSLQQNDNSALWLHGPASRTMSTVPSSTYYGFQSQNQQPGVFRQGQNYGSLGYPNLYHSQAGITLEHHQQQNIRDGSLTGAQGQPKPSQQAWQNGY